MKHNKQQPDKNTTGQMKHQHVEDKPGMGRNPMHDSSTEKQSKDPKMMRDEKKHK
jgi:hypothetical protein